MKKIILIFPNNIVKGQPSYERLHAFNRFFLREGVEVIEREQPKNIKEIFELISFIKIINAKNIFISMPQFRNWWIFFLNDLNIILDIRDGWSIAMKSGYGGSVKPNKFKGWLAKKIENFAIKKSKLTITCTLGLKDYLQDISGKSITLIYNGYSEKDENIVVKLKKKVKKDSSEFVAVCVGKFSEYGKDKVKTAIKILVKNNPDKNIILKLIGSNYDSNIWIKHFLKKNKYSNIKLEILKRMSRYEMYESIIKADIGITIIRDPDYDYGTKIFDYYLCDIPVLNYFETKNNFNNLLDIINSKDKKISFLRENLIQKEKTNILNCII